MGGPSNADNFDNDGAPQDSSAGMEESNLFGRGRWMARGSKGIVSPGKFN